MEKKSWVLGKAGAMENLSLTSSPLETFQPSSSSIVRVAIKAWGLNFADVFSVLGLYEAAPKTDLVPGLEFSGEVEEVGEENSTFQKGDRVFGVARFGAMTTHLDISQDYLRKIPDSWNFEEGAAFPVQALTAFYGLKKLGDLEEGQTVLVHSAAGGVGILSLMILQKFKAKIVGTVGSQGKADYLCKRFGLEPHQIIVRTQGGEVFEGQLRDSLKKLGVEGFDLVFDSLAGDFFMPGYNLLLPGGHLVVFGSGAMMPSGGLGLIEWAKLGAKYLSRPKVDPMKLVGDNKNIHGFNLIYLYNKIDLMSKLLSDLADLHLDPPKIDRSFPFSQAPQALAYFQGGSNIGKIVLTLDPPSEPQSSSS